MSETVFLEDAIEAILDAMVEILDDARTSGGELAEVVAVVRGDRTRPMPKMPALWLVPEPATNSDTSPGLAESWSMPVRIAALVKSDDPAEAGRDCVKLAARARRLVLGVRRLGLAYVNDVTSTAFDAAARHGDPNRNLFWADATVTVRFRIRETS